jgi:hypothetical protein
MERTRRTIKLEVEGLHFWVEGGFLSNDVVCKFHIAHETIQAIEERDPRIWEILEWTVRNREEINLVLEYGESIIEYCGDAIRVGDYSFDRDFVRHNMETIANSTLASDEMREKASNLIRELDAVESRQTKAGYIYVLCGGEYHKIGRSNSIERRMYEIQPKLPFETELAFVFYTDDTVAAESNLHKHFADKHIRGEWFQLSKEDIEWIQSHVTGFATTVYPDKDSLKWLEQQVQAQKRG